jgi:transposase
MKETVNLLFSRHNDLKIAYQIGQNFKHWYDYENRIKSTRKIELDLHHRYGQAMQIAEFEGVIKMIRKHKTEIINFFKHGLTNAKAENLNGKIQRFVSNNYGIKGKDFFLYRTANYFA